MADVIVQNVTSFPFTVALKGKKGAVSSITFPGAVPVSAKSPVRKPGVCRMPEEVLAECLKQAPSLQKAFDNNALRKVKDPDLCLGDHEQSEEMDRTIAPFHRKPQVQSDSPFATRIVSYGDLGSVFQH